jgi:hypothetical protein
MDISDLTTKSPTAGRWRRSRASSAGTKMRFERRWRNSAWSPTHGSEAPPAWFARVTLTRSARPSLRPRPVLSPFAARFCCHLTFNLFQSATEYLNEPWADVAKGLRARRLGRDHGNRSRREGYLKSLPLSRLHRPDWSTVSRPLPRRGCNPNPPFRSGNLPRPATYDLPEASILHRFGSLLD